MAIECIISAMICILHCLFVYYIVYLYITLVVCILHCLFVYYIVYMYITLFICIFHWLFVYYIGCLYITLFVYYIVYLCITLFICILHCLSRRDQAEARGQEAVVAALSLPVIVCCVQRNSTGLVSFLCLHN